MLTLLLACQLQADPAASFVVTGADTSVDSASDTGAPELPAGLVAAEPQPALSLSPPPAPAADEARPPTRYALDDADSFLALVVRPDGSADDEHVLVAESFRGSVRWSSTDPEACEVSLRARWPRWSSIPRGPAAARASIR